MVISLHIHSDAVPLGRHTTRTVARPKGAAHGGRLFLDCHAGGADDDALVAALVRDAALRKLASHPRVAQTIEILSSAGDLYCVVEDLNAMSLTRLVAFAIQESKRLPASFGFMVASAVARLYRDLDSHDVAPAVLTPGDVGLLPGGDVVLLPMCRLAPPDFVAPEITERRYRRGLDTRVWAIGRLLRVLLSTSEEKEARPKVSPSEVDIVRPVLVDLLSPRRSRRPPLDEAADRLTAAAAALAPGSTETLAEMLVTLGAESLSAAMVEDPERKGVGPTEGILLFSFAATDVDTIAPRLSPEVPTGMTSAAERKLLCGVENAVFDVRATMDGSIASPFSSMASRAPDSRSLLDVDVEPPSSDGPALEPKTIQTTAVDLPLGADDDEGEGADDKGGKLDRNSNRSVFDASAKTLVTEIGSSSRSHSDGGRGEDAMLGRDRGIESVEAAFDVVDDERGRAEEDLTSVNADAPEGPTDSAANAGASVSKASVSSPATIQTEIGAFAPGLMQTQAERPSSRSRSRSKSQPTSNATSQAKPATSPEAAASSTLNTDDSRTPEDVFASVGNDAPSDKRATTAPPARDEPTLLVDPAEFGHSASHPSQSKEEQAPDSSGKWTDATNLAPPQSLRIDHKPHRAATAARVWGRSTGGDDDQQVPPLDQFAPFPSTDAGEDGRRATPQAEEDVFAPPLVADDASVEKTEIREPGGSLTTSMTAEFVMSQEAALKVREAAAKALEQQRARVVAEAEAMRSPKIDPSDPFEDRATLDGSIPVELPNALVGRPKANAPLISPALHPGRRDKGGAKGPSLAAQIDAAKPKAPETQVVDQPTGAEAGASQLEPMSVTESGAVPRVTKPPTVNATSAVLPAPHVPRGHSFADEDDSVEGTQTTSIVRAKSAALRSQAGSIDVFRHVSEVMQEPAQVSRLSEPPPRDPTQAGASVQPSYEIVSDEEKGVLVVEARAGATVFLDGIWRGVGRVVITELDRFSSYSVRVHCPGFAPWSGSVSLGGEVAARVRPTLEPR